MPTQRVDFRPLSRQWESMPSRLQTILKARDLWDILGSFPPTTSFLFQETTIHEQHAIRLRVGFREQADGVQASSWAYVLRDPCDLQPPVLIRDELPLVHVRPGLYKRAASSLLRVAGDLMLPFRFLQFYPHNKAKNIRDMLCALVLYYALANGLTDTAIRWGGFQGSLIQALEYIDSNADYQLWRSHQVGRQDTTTHVPVLPVFSPNEVVEDEIKHDPNEGVHTGGTVCSFGSSVSVKPGSNIAKLMKALGDRVILLDAIPPTPISLDQQDLYPTYSPLRLHLGQHDDSKVYVYLTQDIKGSSKILAQRDNETLSWTFADLSEIHLVEPFAYIMTLKQDLRTRGNKIRYLVFYYFMLAENAGLIGVSKTQTSFQSMIVPLCAACKNLEEAYFDVDTPLQGSHSTERGQDEENMALSESLIVNLKVRPEDLVALDKTTLVSQHNEVVDSEDEEIELEPSLNDDQLHHDAAAREPEKVHKTVEPEPSRIYMSRYHAHVEDAGDVEPYASAPVRDGSHDSGFESSYVSPVSVPAAAEIPARSPHIEDRIGRIPDELVHHKSTDANNEPESKLPDPLVSDAIGPSSEKPDIFQWATSHLSISSDKSVDAKETVKRATGSSTSGSKPAMSGGSHIIDLCSDDEDVATPAASSSSIGATPGNGATPRPDRPSSSAIENEELRWPSSKKRKRMPAVYISSDEDDDVFEEVDGGSWKRASLRQTQR